MTIASTLRDDLDWHSDWVEALAEERALLALFETQGGLFLGKSAPEPWQRIGLAFAADVGEAMSGIEEPDFIEGAKLAAVEIYIRHLHRLLKVSSKAGCA